MSQSRLSVPQENNPAMVYVIEHTGYIVLPEFYKGRIELISYDEALKRLYAAPFGETVCVMRGSGYIIYLPFYNGEIEFIPYITAVERNIAPTPGDPLSGEIFWRSMFEQNQIQDASLLDPADQNENAPNQIPNEPKEYSIQTRAKTRATKKTAQISNSRYQSHNETQEEQLYVTPETTNPIYSPNQISNEPEKHSVQTRVRARATKKTAQINNSRYQHHNETREEQLYVIPGTTDLVDRKEYLKKHKQEPEQITWEEFCARKNSQLKPSGRAANAVAVDKKLREKKVLVIVNTGYYIRFLDDNTDDQDSYEGDTEVLTYDQARKRRNDRKNKFYQQTRKTQLYVAPETCKLVHPEKYFEKNNQKPERITWKELCEQRKKSKSQRITMNNAEKAICNKEYATRKVYTIYGTATEKYNTQAQKRGHESNSQDVAPPTKKRKTKSRNNATTNNETTTLHHPYVTNQQPTNPLTMFGHTFAQTSVSLDTNNVEHHSSHVSNAINCAVNNNDQGELYFDLEREELVLNSTSWW